VVTIISDAPFSDSEKSANRTGEIAMRRPWGLLKPFLVLMFVVIGIPGLIQIGLWLWHPMFCNTFVMSDRVPFGFWSRQQPCEDGRGNAATADYRHNILSVFLIEGSNVTYYRFWYPRAKNGGAAFSALHDEDKIDFSVPKCTNRLFVFGADGRRMDFPLASGEAERIFKLMRPYAETPDLVKLLEVNYAEKHSPEYSVKLREAIAKLGHENGVRNHFRQ
jgi:hypothetical protein